MKRRDLFLPIATMLLMLAATGCKGRTLDNVVPDGDTVEVDPGCGSPEPVDSIIQL